MKKLLNKIKKVKKHTFQTFKDTMWPRHFQRPYKLRDKEQYFKHYESNASAEV